MEKEKQLPSFPPYPFPLPSYPLPSPLFPHTQQVIDADLDGVCQQISWTFFFPL